MPKGGPDIHTEHVHNLAHAFHSVIVFVCHRATCSRQWAVTASTEVGRGGQRWVEGAPANFYMGA